jgi:hypothetical protein
MRFIDFPFQNNFLAAPFLRGRGGTTMVSSFLSRGPGSRMSQALPHGGTAVFGKSYKYFQFPLMKDR